jgi:ornithine carbamoyltransferase
MAGPRHFLDLDRLDTTSLRQMVDRGLAFKRGEDDYLGQRPLRGLILALVFEKPSTRTRVSFEAGMRQLGGDVIVLTHNDTQLGRGETIADTARVLSRYVNAIMLRTNDPRKLDELAEYAAVPVINGLTDRSHPCQVMGDVMTFEEHRGSMAGRTVAWSGDGNNVATSWIHAAHHFGFALRLACPAALAPSSEAVAWARDRGAVIALCDDPKTAARDADCIVTDVWLSMGCEDASRHALLAPFQVNEAVMAVARPDALFMHCLPAHRGEEVTAGVIDGPQSVVWDEVENRMHIQKSILTWCLT